jgi:alanine racemase
MDAPPAAAPGARLTLDLDALAHNWRAALRMAGGAEACAVVKADAYGLGMAPVARRLWREGARQFFVAQWGEAAALRALLPDADIGVFNGLGEADLPLALAGVAAPVLNTMAEAARWAAAAPGARAHLMVDTGINRLGVAPADLSDLPGGLAVDLLMSHLACACLPGHTMNEAQRAAFAALPPVGRAKSLATSHGLRLGPPFAFDHVRPGLALYGGTGAPFRAVARIEARVLQLRQVPAGASVGYDATWTAARPSRLATLAIGYADGWRRGLSNAGWADIEGARAPIVGRVSMDLTVIDLTDVRGAGEGDWVALGFDLPALAAASGLAEYELLTGLGRRFARVPDEAAAAPDRAAA